VGAGSEFLKFADYVIGFSIGKQTIKIEEQILKLLHTLA
jgi:hypothetical protein